MFPVASSSIAISDSDKEDADVSSSESLSLSEAFLAKQSITLESSLLYWTMFARSTAIDNA
eukprot:10937886-Ditylum_brightwellii.AAC.1